jgi:hypothetical protein
MTLPTFVPTRLRGLAFFLLLVLTMVAMAGCRGRQEPGDPTLTMEVDISPTPPAVGPAQILVTLQDTAGAPLGEAVVTVEGNMSHAGMVPVVDTAHATRPGRYMVPDFDFTMAGDWVLTVQADLPDGRTARLEYGTTVVGPPSNLQADTTNGSEAPPSTDRGTGG